MKYHSPLPKLSELESLAHEIEKYPISVRQALRKADQLGYSQEVIDLLSLFHGEFESQADFYARTSELVVLIREEQSQPREVVLSQQD